MTDSPGLQNQSPDNDRPRYCTELALPPELRNAYKEAIRAGKLRARRVGKRSVVTEAELNAWIESCPLIEASKRGAERDPELDELDTVLAGGGVRRRGGAL